MEYLDKEIKNKKALIFIAMAGVILVVVIFLIAFIMNNKRSENPIAPILEKKNAFDSLSVPVSDPSGKPALTNHLDSLSAPVPIVSPPPSTNNKKSPVIKPAETPKSYIDYLSAPIK